MLSRAFSLGSSELCEAIQDALRVQSSISDKDMKLLTDSRRGGSGMDVSRSSSEMEKFWRRTVCSGVHLQYLFDRDGKGVFSFLGRDGNQRQWKNPMLSKKITVKASSPTGRLTSPKVLTRSCLCELPGNGKRFSAGDCH